MAKRVEETEGEVVNDIPFKYRYRQHGGGWVFGLLVIFIGAVFLFNNLGLLSWNIWNELWKFWPVLLILWGLKMLFGRSAFARFIFIMIGLFILVGMFTYVLYYQGIFTSLNLPLIK
jgi:type IV secretory pathway VirB2 component (pilin)